MQRLLSCMLDPLSMQVEDDHCPTEQKNQTKDDGPGRPFLVEDDAKEPATETIADSCHKKQGSGNRAK